MPRKRHTPEQIVTKLREVEILISQGKTIKQACKSGGISDFTFRRWKNEYGGMRVNHVKQLKDLEKENAQLKKLVADQALDISILKEVSRGKF